jgi:hypothetical protein
MLKGIPNILSPLLLKTLMEMGLDILYILGILVHFRHFRHFSSL